MLPFSLAAGLSCPTHAVLAAALAAEFHPVDERGVDEALDALAAALAPTRDEHPVEQLDELRRTMEAFAVDDAPLDPDALLIDTVIDRLAGHPATLAVIGCSAAQRAGLDVGVLAAGPGALRAAHRALEPPRAAWRCAHQVAFVLLAEQIERAQRCGDIAAALRAGELRLELPLGPGARTRVEGELAMLRALLN
ncbi:MAG TPA: transglutaminase family protein [Capillimicrobium sp.]